MSIMEEWIKLPVNYIQHLQARLKAKERRRPFGLKKKIWRKIENNGYEH